MNDILILSGVFLLEIILFYFLPTLNGKGTLFGFIVHENNGDSSVSEILKKYRLGLVAIALFFLSAIVGGIFYFRQSLVFIYILSTLVMGWWLHTNFLRSWRMRKVETFSKFATSLKPRKLLDFTNIWWELAIILLTFVPIAVLIHFYPELPEKVPVHWNGSGEADRWGAKSIFNVFFISFLGLYLQVFTLILKMDMVKAKFRVPAENAEKILPLKEISHRVNISLIDWCRLMVPILFAAINSLLLSVLATEIVATVTNIILWAGVVLLIVGIAFYFYQLVLANRQIREIAGEFVFQTAGEEKGWEDGLFYKNADDVAFFVEKPGGMGYTLNFANKRAYLYLGMVGLLIIISTLAPILL